MNNITHVTVWACASLLLSAIMACGAPHRDYPVTRIETVDNLAELMDVQATVSDPCFDLVDDLAGAEMTDSHWEKFRDMGTRLQATTRRVKEFSMGEDFERWNRDMGMRAAELVTHATDRDQAGAFASIRAIEKSCSACHTRYR